MNGRQDKECFWGGTLWYAGYMTMFFLQKFTKTHTFVVFSLCYILMQSLLFKKKHIKSRMTNTIFTRGFQM